MARIRTIKPEFPQSESMGRVSREARLCFVLLWTLADDSGRLRGNSRMLASLLYPYDDDAPRLIDAWLDELEREGCIQRYAIDGDRYLAISAWAKHQKIDKPSASKLPAASPEFVEASRALSKPREVSSEDLDLDLDQGREGKGKDPSSPDGEGCADGKAAEPKVSAAFDRFWAPWPRKEGKEAARKAFDRLKPDETLLATMLAAVAVQRLTPNWLKDGGQFIPHPATWLNGRRWEDEVQADTASKGTKHSGFDARNHHKGVTHDGVLKL